jgi:hypothetical protein
MEMRIIFIPRVRILPVLNPTPYYATMNFSVPHIKHSGPLLYPRQPVKPPYFDSKTRCKDHHHYHNPLRLEKRF